MSVSCFVFGYGRRWSEIKKCPQSSNSKRDANFPLSLFLTICSCSAFFHIPPLFNPASVPYLQRWPGLALTREGGVLWERLSEWCFIGEENPLCPIERKTPELSSWIKPPRTKPKTRSVQSVSRKQCTMLPWHRNAGL